MTDHPQQYFEDVAVGDALPSLEFTTSLTALVMYAGATWDFHRYHYDPEFVKQIGMPAPFMDGQMLGALMSGMLMNWGGRDAFVRRLSYRQRATVFEGDEIVLSAVVVDKSQEAGRSLVHVRLDVSKADGTAVSRDARASVELAMRNREGLTQS